LSKFNDNEAITYKLDLVAANHVKQTYIFVLVDIRQIDMPGIKLDNNIGSTHKPLVEIFLSICLPGMLNLATATIKASCGTSAESADDAGSFRQ